MLTTQLLQYLVIVGNILKRYGFGWNIENLVNHYGLKELKLWPSTSFKLCSSMAAHCTTGKH